MVKLICSRTPDDERHELQWLHITLEQERNADNKMRCDLTAPKADRRSFETKLAEKRDMIADLQASLEREKHQIVDLNSALE